MFIFISIFFPVLFLAEIVHKFFALFIMFVYVGTEIPFFRIVLCSVFSISFLILFFQNYYLFVVLKFSYKTLFQLFFSYRIMPGTWTTSQYQSNDFFNIYIYIYIYIDAIFAVFVLVFIYLNFFLSTIDRHTIRHFEMALKGVHRYPP